MRGRTRKLRGSNFFAEGLAEASFEKLQLSIVFEPLAWKHIKKSSRKPFAEAAAEGGSKKDYKQYSRKVRGRPSRKV